MALTQEQQTAVNNYAAAINKRNREHGGRVGVSLSNPTLGIDPRTFINVPNPEGLSPDQQLAYNNAVKTILESQFKTGLQTGEANAGAIEDFIEFQQSAIAKVADSFEDLNSGDNGKVQTAQQTINNLVRSDYGDLNDNNSPLENFRREGSSYFQGTNNIAQSPLQQAAYGALEQPTQLNAADYQIGNDIRDLVQQSQQARQNISYNQIPTASAARLGPTTTASASQIAPIQQIQDPSGRYAATPSMRAAQVAAVPGIRDPAGNYMATPQGGAARVEYVQPRRADYADEMINSAPVDMVFSEFEDPSYYEGIDRSGIDAMGRGMQYFSDLLDNEGHDAVSDAYFHRKQQEAEQNRRANIEAALRDLDTRGMGTGGAALQARVSGANQSMKSQFDAAMESAAMAQQRRDNAAQMQADIGAAHRQILFGEARDMDEALRQVRTTRGQLEFSTQAENTQTITNTREAAQRFEEAKALQNAMMENNMNLANLDARLQAAQQRNAFLNQSALQTQDLQAKRDIQNAILENNANIENLRTQAAAAQQRNAFLNDSAMQLQRLEAERSTNQAGLNTDVSKYNAGAYNQANIAQAGYQNAVNIANANNQATEYGNQNRYLEQGVETDFNRLANATASDATVKYGVDSGNLQRQSANYGTYLSALDAAEGRRVDAYNAATTRSAQNQPVDPVALGLGIFSAGLNTAGQYAAKAG